MTDKYFLFVNKTCQYINSSFSISHLLFLVFLLNNSHMHYIMKAIIIFVISFLLAMTNGDIQTFTSGNNRFMGDVYKKIKTTQENILVSPLSAEMILSLARAGAKGETGKELDTALHLPNTTEEIESSVKSILTSLQNDQGDSAIHMANKIYVRSDIPLRDEFKKVATEIYKSDLENVNFLQKQQAADIMNKWVEAHTNNKIHDIINADDLDPKTATILINALYFKGKWRLPFDSTVTKKQKFYKTSQDVTEVAMMNLHEKFFGYFEDSKLNAKFLELPFEMENVSMVFVLPNEKDGISVLENRIDEVFSERHFSEVRLNVGIPKFRIESEIDFKEILMNLGVKKAFNKDQADFSGMSNLKLWIDKVKQKTFIDVNEIGVEAAAATVAEFFYMAAWSDPPKEFVADHPFIFYIKSGNLILFAGKLSTPNQ